MCKFYPSKRYTSGCPCDSCEGARSRAKRRYATKREEILAQKRAYHLEHRESRLEGMRAHYRANLEVAASRSKAWRGANREANAEKMRAWQRANPTRVNALSQAYRARKRGLDHGCVTPAIWASFYGLPCAYCGRIADHVDHIVPLAKGGLHCKANLAPACASCNRGKRDRLLPEELRPTPRLECAA